MSATRKADPAPVAVFGTAHLYGLTPDDRSGALLAAAWDAGFRAFDTAPLYGHGRSEAELGLQVRRWGVRPQLTSKVGLDAAAPPSRAVRLAKLAARRLPGAVQDRLRHGREQEPRGVFDPDLVRWSLDRTLSRLGRVDRLMLHEAHADDVSDEVLAVLASFRDRGDVGQVGVATQNAATLDVVRRAPDLVTAVHVEVGPFAEVIEIPETVGAVVGHGVFGAGGSGLRRLSARLESGDDTALRWRAVVDGTRWSGTAGLADALVARAAAQPLTDVIVATSRPARLANLKSLAARAVRMPDAVGQALDDLVRAARASEDPPGG